MSSRPASLGYMNKWDWLNNKQINKRFCFLRMNGLGLVPCILLSLWRHWSPCSEFCFLVCKLKRVLCKHRSLVKTLYFFFLHFFIVSVYGYTDTGHMLVTGHEWKSEDSLHETVLSCSVGPGAWPRITRFDRRLLPWLSQLFGPIVRILWCCKISAAG